jgi:hypothetical protein
MHQGLFDKDSIGAALEEDTMATNTNIKGTMSKDP